MHEEFVRGTASEVAAVFTGRDSVKGEITLLIARAPERPAGTDSVIDVFQRYIEMGMSRMDAMKATARDCGLNKREVYAQLEKRTE